MNEEELKEMASQLRKPEGETGIKTGEWMNTGNLHINKDTLKTLNAGKEDTILEIGMGNGFFVNEILQHKPLVKYTGCDFSDVMVWEAEKHNSEWIKKGQAVFLHTNINSLPLENETFDKIFTINTIYFWEDEKNVLAELKRILKPGGIVIIALRPKRQMLHYPFIKYGFNLFSKEDVVLALTKAGFSISEIKENPEPDFEINGEIIKMENLLITALKS